MSVLLGFAQEQIDKIKIQFPSPYAVLGLNDRQIISGIIYVIERRLSSSNAPKVYGSCKTPYNRFSGKLFFQNLLQHSYRVSLKNNRNSRLNLY